MAINMMRTIQSQSAQSGVGIVNTSRPITRTNDAFFVEQVQNINVIADDKQLVDFLYKLGSGASMIRVRDLELQPDAAAPASQRQHPARRQLPEKSGRRQFETRNRKGKMKTTTLALILFLTGLDLWAQTPPANAPDCRAACRDAADPTMPPISPPADADAQSAAPPARRPLRPCRLPTHGSAARPMPDAAAGTRSRRRK